MNNYNIRSLDLDTRFEFLIIYKYKDDNSISTWTLGNAFALNYKMMKNDNRIEILGVYRKMKVEELEAIK